MVVKLQRQSNFRAKNDDSKIEDEESPITTVGADRYNKIHHLELTHKSLKYFEQQVVKLKRMKQLSSSHKKM